LSAGYELVAHRGHALEFPENTLPALQSALELGVRWLELDVQLSRDHVPIVLHDDTLVRTTGTEGSVFEHSAAELLQLDAGEPARFGARFAGVRLPLLREALVLIRQWPDSHLFVEIKTESLRHFGHERVVQQVLAEVAVAASQCVVISFDERAVQMARELAGLSIAWVLRRYDAAARARAEVLRPEFLFCNYTRFDATEPPWPGPWRWAAYEVRDPVVARQLAARGVTLIETMAVRQLLAAA
jgi:glycerophosphoryl diester phosphodiesterase